MKGVTPGNVVSCPRRPVGFNHLLAAAALSCVVVRWKGLIGDWPEPCSELCSILVQQQQLDHVIYDETSWEEIVYSSIFHVIDTRPPSVTARVISMHILISIRS